MVTSYETKEFKQLYKVTPVTVLLPTSSTVIYHSYLLQRRDCQYRDVNTGLMVKSFLDASTDLNCKIKARNNPYPDHVKRLHWDLIMMESWRRWVTPCCVYTTWWHILDVVISWEAGCVRWVHRHVCDLIWCWLWSRKMPTFLLIGNFSEEHYVINCALPTKKFITGTCTCMPITCTV